jgi:hypothetical protein
MHHHNGSFKPARERWTRGTAMLEFECSCQGWLQSLVLDLLGRPAAGVAQERMRRKSCNCALSFE